MKTMTTDSKRANNGGCSHVACSGGGRVLVTTRLGLFGTWKKKYKHTWICGKCGKTFFTYSYAY